MAECSFTRCIQQRRFIRKQLRKWTTNMVHIVGLERLAEELMGQKQWQLYRESMANNQEICNNNIPTISDKHNNIDDHAHGHDNDGDNNNADQDIQDWSPSSQCQFCVDGVLGHDHNGTLGSPQGSDCDTSDSDLETAPTLLNPQRLYDSKPAIANTLFGKHFSCDNLNSMATSLAAVSALNNSTSLFPANWYFSQFPKHFPLNRSNTPLSTSGPEMNKHHHHHHLAEQPLDLSAKTPLDHPQQQQPLSQQQHYHQQPIQLEHTPQIQKVLNHRPRLSTPNLDNRHIFKAKPRMSSVAGRRTYTEDELQAALQDIQSGKLGTRRAAVIYGIPRSTLRNKVYKLAMEREKETLSQNSIVDLKPATLKIEDDDEIIDEDKDLSGAEDEKEVEKALQQPLITIADILRFSNLNNDENLRNLLHKCHENQEFLASMNFENNPLGPFLQNLLLSGRHQQSQHHSEKINDEQQTRTPSSPTPQSVIVKNEQAVPKTHDYAEKDEESSVSNVILKIPSFRPSSTSSSSSSTVIPPSLKSNLSINVAPSNEMVASTSYRPPIDTPMVLTSPRESESSPVLPGGSNINTSTTQNQMQTPSVNKSISLRDVIARSINQNYPQNSAAANESLKTMEMDFKRQFAAPPLAILNNHNHNDRNYFVKGFSNQNSNNNNNNNSSSSNQNSAQGGKGTRPKRGKYRNYDRDSLVEAVRAVQRGEMSVHRAGSYYGVPHSTLEYKVKERHLMRPRKRDPKPPVTNLDEKTPSSMAINKNIPVDKNKQINPSLLNKPPVQKYSPTSSPNGLKMFDPTAAPMNYVPPQFPFWHPSFHGIPMEYGRNSTNHPHPPSHSFPLNSEQIFNAQMLHKLQQQQQDVQNKTSSETSMAEPTMLDGIIRSSLESNQKHHHQHQHHHQAQNLETVENKVLLEQLCRNSNRLTPQPTANIAPGTPSNSNIISSYLQDTNSSSNDSFLSIKRIGPSPRTSLVSDSPPMTLSSNNNNEGMIKQEIDSDESSNHVPPTAEILGPEKEPAAPIDDKVTSLSIMGSSSTSNGKGGSSEFFSSFKKDNNAAAMFMEKNGLFETAKVCASESNFDLVQD